MRRITKLFHFPDNPQLVLRWLVALTAIDLLLVALFLAMRFMQGLDLLPGVPPLFDIFSDNGLSERFNHLKWASISFFLMLAFICLRVPALFAMSILFSLILVDDALQLHEIGGEWIATAWPDIPKFGMTAFGIGEILIWILLGFFVVPILTWGFLATPRKWWGQIYWPILGFSGIIFFAIGMDVAQQPLWHLENKAVFYWGKMGIGLVEDTGEAIFGSLTVSYAIGIWHVCAREFRLRSH